MRAKDFIPPSKPRNPVVRQQQTSGAGTHKDKKKAQKQGDVKHKKKMFDEEQGVAEISKPTLGRYIKAASKDIEQRASSQSFKSGQAGDKYNKADVTHKDTRREKGIDRALGKLTREK